MKIALKEPDLELEVIRVDIPKGIGWCVLMPDERKILLTQKHEKWETNDIICDQFVQAIGTEITGVLEEQRIDNLSQKHATSNPKAKRARILKYFLI